MAEVGYRDWRKVGTQNYRKKGERQCWSTLKHVWYSAQRPTKHEDLMTVQWILGGIEGFICSFDCMILFWDVYWKNSL